MLSIFLFYSFLLGLICGSFANVYFYRIPKELSLIRPRSQCPQCSHPIEWRDNIPVISYLLLHGKCRWCGMPISSRYPLIETACAVLFSLVAWKFRQEPVSIAFGFMIFAFLIFLIGGIDLVTYFHLDKQYGIIPDHLVGTTAVLGFLFSPFNPYFPESFWISWVTGIGAGLLMLLLRWTAQTIIQREALGLGDVKLIAVIGLWLGWKGIASALVIGSFSGSLLSIFLILTKKMDRHSAIPFAPFLAAGSLSALFIF